MNVPLNVQHKLLHWKGTNDQSEKERDERIAAKWMDNQGTASRPVPILINVIRK